MSNLVKKVLMENESSISLVGTITISFDIWTINTPYFNGIRSTVRSECAESTEWETDALAN